MANQQQEQADLLDLSRRAFVWISEEDQKLAKELLERQTRKTNILKKGANKEKPVFICDYCEKQFSCSSHLKQHVTAHTGQKDYSCKLCDFSCAQKSHLTVHIGSHLNERPFKCHEPSCGASFTQSGNLKRHQLVHNKKDKKFSCSACPFKTHAKSCLTGHVKNIHSESRSFECPHENCEYSAKQKSGLNEHLKIHSVEKTQVCPYPNCGYKTKLTGGFKIHTKSHSGEEKKYKCIFCSYSSHRHGNLVRHIRQHTGETPFACKLCPFKSKDQSQLNRHIKTH